MKLFSQVVSQGKNGYKKSFPFVFTFFLIFSLTFFPDLNFTAQANTEESKLIRQLQAIATTLNKQFPTKIDKYTHITKIKLGEGAVLEYHYLLHDMVYKDDNILINFDTLRQANIASFCSNKVSREIIDKGTRLDLIYIGMLGDELSRFSITENDCLLLSKQDTEKSAMSQQEQLDKHIQVFVQGINAQLPLKIDNYTTLKNLMIRDGHRIEFNYLLNDTRISEQQIPINYEAVRLLSIKSFCANKVNRETLKLGAVFDLIYLGNSGDEIMNFSIQESDCE